MKQKINKIIRIIIIMPIIFYFLSIAVFGAEYSGTFNYMLSLENSSKEDRFFYSDDYFSKSGKEKNIQLRTMSMVIALATFSSEDKDIKSRNILDVTQKIGFNEGKVQIDDMEQTPSKESIGSVICHKKINNSNVVLVAIRGERYSMEWGSNVLLGNEKDATGFVIAKDKIIARIKKYLEENKLNNVKLWITGYSRAASTSNLTGKYINEHLDEFGITDNDLYVYTFEGQNCSADDTKYENIHNIVDENDIFTYIYPKNWDLYSNGVVENIGDDSKFLKPRYLDFYIFPIKSAPEIKQREFIEEFSSWFGETISRKNYYEVEENISKIASIFASKTSDNLLNLTFGEIWTIVTSIPSFIKIVFKFVISDLFYKDENTNINYPFYHTLTLLMNYEKIFTEHYGQNIFNLIKLLDRNYIA